jgi:flagellar FliJ protein
MQTLHLLLEHEEAERDGVLRQLQQAEEQSRRARSQADLLFGYRDEYRQRWSARFAGGGSMPLVQCYQGFMHRLELAITQQMREVERAEARVQQTRAALTAQQQRVASVRKLIERRQREQLVKAQRQDQKVSDEAALRRPRRSNPWQPSDAVPFAA